MSYGITPIAVSLAKVESHIGPAQGGLFRRQGAVIPKHDIEIIFIKEVQG